VKAPSVVFVCLLVLAYTLVPVAGSSGQRGQSDSNDESRVRIGLAIAPVHPQSRAKKPRLGGAGQLYHQRPSRL